MRYLIFILAVLLLLNSISFVAVRLLGKISGELTLIRSAPPVREGEGVVMHYFIGDPEDKRFMSLISQDLRGGITFVERAKAGWKPEVTADLVASDITTHNYRPKIITFGVGDQVARYLESEIRALEVIAITPCSNPNFLRFPMRIWLSCFSIILSSVCIILGWFSPVISINSRGNIYSLALYADLCFAMAYNFPPETYTQTLGLILEEKSCRFNSRYAEQFFSPARKIYLKKGRSLDKKKNDQAFLETYRALMKQLA